VGVQVVEKAHANYVFLYFTNDRGDQVVYWG